MTAEIVWEGSTLCRTLWWGMVFAAEYDTIRIFRRIVKHNMLVIMVLEDMAYWIYVDKYYWEKDQQVILWPIF